MLNVRLSRQKKPADDTANTPVESFINRFSVKKKSNAKRANQFLVTTYESVPLFSPWTLFGIGLIVLGLALARKKCTSSMPVSLQ